ncbi:MAG TPA: cellulase family glycosylhydrolase [Planctomycetota bacterium]|nr:cellulase family glycosylhydrolase [Planctomycetota bacterium]
MVLVIKAAFTLLLLSALLILSGCESAGAASRNENKPSLPSVSKEEIKSEIPTLTGVLLDGFEGPAHTVWAFDSADDEGVAEYVADGATQGTKALRVTIREAGRKGRLHLRRDVHLDLSQASALLFDITSPAEKLSATLAIKTNPGDSYQECRPIELQKGLNRDVRFSLEGNGWKNEKTKWEYAGPPVNLHGLHRIMLLLSTGKEDKGAFVVDNLRVEGNLLQKPEDAGNLYREWRPEIIGMTPPPKATTQYSGFEMQVAFRASYRDIFDSNDLTIGLRVTTPSGKAQDVRGFFGGVYRNTGELQAPGDGAAPYPLWGPFSKRRGKGRKDGGAEKQTEGGDEKAESKHLSGMPLWLIRYTPQEVGRYTLHLYIRNSAGETRTREVSLVVAPEAPDPTRPGCKGGNVRVSKRDGRQLELQDGSPFFIFGQNVCWAQTWKPYLEKIKAYGGNTCRIWLCPWGLNLERQTDPGTYDLKEAERIDELLEEAEATGVRIIFCFTFHGMNGGEWWRSPYNQANGGPCARPQDFFSDWRAKRQFKRLLSYAASRWGCSPALLSWELINEMDLARFDNPDDVGAWSREMAGHLKSVDVHNHLVTTSSTNVSFQPDLWNDGRIDFISVHGYGTDVPALVQHYLSPFRSVLKPVVLAEFGGGTEPADDIPDKDGARLQASLWLTACSPNAGLALPWWWDTYIEARNLYPVLASAGRFIAGDDRRERYSEWVRKPLGGGAEAAGIMDSQGARLYVYNSGWIKTPESRGAALLAAATPLELSGMIDGAYKIEFWDAKEGKIFASSEVVSREGLLRLELPQRAMEFGIKVDRTQRLRPGLK